MKSRQEFAALSAFAAIVQHGSFARAAGQLGVTPSALSQTIRGLEERMGVRLLHRTTRSVAPSEAGARLIERLAPALRELDAAVASVDADAVAQHGRLRINVPRVVAMRMLAPRLERFRQAHPYIELELVVEDAFTDIVKGRFDAGVRLGKQIDRDMIAVKLGDDLRVVTVASPHYIAEHGEPRRPRDLLRHRCINWRSPSSGMIFRWKFEQRGRAFEIAAEGMLIVNDIEVAVQAAIAGAGIAYVSEPDAREALAAGALVTLLEPWMPRVAGFHLYYPDRRISPALRQWLEFLRAEGLVPSERTRRR